MPGRKLFFEDIPEENGIVVHYDKNRSLPFAVEHIVTISDVPEGEVRMKCACITSACVITSLKGSAILELDNVKEQRVFQLRRKSDGVFVPKMTWIRLSSFSPGAIIMIMGDKNLAKYKWIEDYGEFVEQKLARMRRKPKPARNLIAEKEAAEKAASEQASADTKEPETKDAGAEDMDLLQVYGYRVEARTLPTVDLEAMDREEGQTGGEQE